jgi:hypothetical protein
MTARANRLAEALGWSEETLAVAVEARRHDRDRRDHDREIECLRAVVLEPHLAVAAANYRREGQRLEAAIRAATSQHRGSAGIEPRSKR